MAYTTWDLVWWVNDMRKNKLFDLFVWATDVYIMPIMFLIAGYFTPVLLLNKGIKLFWQDKLRRIVLPWLAGVLFIAPLIGYSALVSNTDTQPNYLSFWANDFFGEYYQQAHYWFLELLAIFFLLFTIAYILRPSYFREQPQSRIPSVWFFLLFALFSAVPFFIGNLFFWSDAWIHVKRLIMIQPVRVGLYLCYFALGVYAWKNAWFTWDGYRPCPVTWSIAAVIMLFVFLYYRVTFTLMPDVPVLFKAGHALVFSFFSLTAAFSFIALFQRFADSDAYLWRRLAANSYTIYFIHQCVVIPLAFAVQKIQFNIWIKYLGVSVAAVTLCFLISEYIISPALSLTKKDGKPL
ncbi:MAG: acyltransferase 3 [Anaerosporomusa subterranea]|nr:acyltransferase 3 [Anaerosporomusa subterranea]